MEAHDERVAVLEGQVEKLETRVSKLEGFRATAIYMFAIWIAVSLWQRWA